MSVQQGTLFAVGVGEAVLVEDGEVVEGLLPVFDGHRRFARGFADRHIDVLQGRVVAGINLAVPRELANHAVDRFDRVGRVNRPADRRRIVEQRDNVREMRPCAAV